MEVLRDIFFVSGQCVVRMVIPYTTTHFSTTGAENLSIDILHVEYHLSGNLIAILLRFTASVMASPSIIPCTYASPMNVNPSRAAS